MRSTSSYPLRVSSERAVLLSLFTLGIWRGVRGILPLRYVMREMAKAFPDNDDRTASNESIERKQARSFSERGLSECGEREAFDAELFQFFICDNVSTVHFSA